MRLRILLLIAPGLALSACAPGSGEGEDDTPGVPPGFELAAAKQPSNTVLDGNRAPGIDAPDQQARVVDIGVPDLSAALASGNVRLIDVRTAEEVAEGKIPGAEHIALDTFEPATLDFSDGREVILYCRSGRRSAIAGERLAQHTGEPSRHLAGGIIAWKQAGGAVE